MGQHRREGSPYSIQLDSDWQLDASCHRSYAAMCNHRGGMRANATLMHVPLVPRHFQPMGVNNAPPGRRDLTLRGYNTAADVWLELPTSYPSRGLFGRQPPGPVWLVARKDIPANAEITADYGPRAAAVIAAGASSRTVPPLCQRSDQRRRHHQGQ